MLIRFQAEWYTETTKWVDASIKTAAVDNKELVSGWTKAWRDRAIKAVTPLAQLALGDQAESVMAEIVQQFNARAAKLGLAL
jgi:phenol hydroxylase P1 protein